MIILLDRAIQDMHIHTYVVMADAVCLLDSLSVNRHDVGYEFFPSFLSIMNFVPESVQ